MGPAVANQQVRPRHCVGLKLEQNDHMSQVYISALREAEGEVREIEETLERLRPGGVRVVRPSVLPLTRNYVHSLEAEIDGTGVMLVFVGPKWLEAISDVKSHPVGRLLRWEIHQAQRIVHTTLAVTLCDQLGDHPDFAITLRSLRLRRFDWREDAASAQRLCEQLLAWLDFDAACRRQMKEAIERSAAREAHIKELRSRLGAGRPRKEVE